MSKYKYHKDGTLPPETHWVWVFGSNLAGIHGAGSARIAHVTYGRPYGVNHANGFYQTWNLQETYAIPTKDADIQTLLLHEVIAYIEEFKTFVENNPNKMFFVTRIGCGLAGYTDEVIAPFFEDFPTNCSFAEAWKDYLED